MQKRAYYIIAFVYIIVACREGSKTGPTAVADTTHKKDSIPRKLILTVEKVDTSTAVLLDTVIAGQAIVISRKGDTAQDYMDFSISGKKLRFPQGAHRAAGLYNCIINLDDPTLASNSVRWRDGVLMATFDLIFAHGELYIIRSTKDSLEALTFEGDKSGDKTIIGFNGAFFVDPVRKYVISFGIVDPDKKLTPVLVCSIGKHHFRYIGSFNVATEEYYDMNKSVVIKAYLKWVKRR